MMKPHMQVKVSVILQFTLSSFNFLFGQEDKQSFWKPYIDADVKRLDLASFDSLICQKAYRIWYPHQVIELIELEDSHFSGQLVNFATRITRKGEPLNTVNQNLIIPNYTVPSLMADLMEENIETLPDSYEVDNYVNGLDGTTLIFEILVDNQYRLYSYWEPENDHYQDSTLMEVKQIRNIIAIIKGPMDLERLYSRFTDGLERGDYEVGGVILRKW